MKAKKEVKKVCLILFYALLLLIVFLIMPLKTMAYVKTGHEEFMEINFLDKKDKLLINRDAKEIEEGYKKVSDRRVFGWKTYYFNINSQANYIGDILLSRSNRTNNPFIINYKVEEQTFKDRSYRINGSVSGKVTFGGSKSKVEGSISPSFGGYYDRRDSHTKEETTDFKLNIMPHTKLTLRITGEAYVTSGVSKYYFLGLCLRKGEWERVDVETMYYELVEENLE